MEGKGKARLTQLSCPLLEELIVMGVPPSAIHHQVLHDIKYYNMMKSRRNDSWLWLESMNGWMDGSIDQYIDRWINRLIDGWIDRSMGRLIEGSMYGWMDRSTDGWMDGSMDRWMDRSNDLWINGFMDWSIDGLTDGLIDRSMDWSMVRCINWLEAMYKTERFKERVCIR